MLNLGSDFSLRILRNIILSVLSSESQKTFFLNVFIVQNVLLMAIIVFPSSALQLVPTSPERNITTSVSARVRTFYPELKLPG